MSQCAEEFRRRESFSFSLLSVIEKVRIKKRGESIKIFRRIFLSVGAEKFPRGNPLVFH